MSTQSQQSEIIIKVFIDNKPYEIDCDTGIQDVAWLALSACYLYGQETYPTTTYLPIMAKNKQGQILHPKLVILQNRQLIGDEINIKVKRKYGTIGSELSPEEEDWYDNAFGEGRFMQTVSAYLKPVNEIKRDNRFKLEYDFEMEDNIAIFFPEFQGKLYFELEETERKGEYAGVKKIPFGKMKLEKIIFCEKGTNTWDKETTDFIKNDVVLKKSPDILSSKKKEEYLRQKEEQIRAKEIKIKQDIINAEKEKVEEEQRMIKLKEYMSQIPFTLEEIYSYTQSEITMDEQDLVEIFEIMERNEYLIFRKLFEIFNDYCKFYKDNEELTIDGLAENNFLNTYFEKRENLEDISEEFQREYIARFEKDTSNIDFKEFVYIIIFLLTSILKHKDIKITEEIQALYSTHEEIIKNKSYQDLYKNDKVSDILKENHLVLRNVFEKFGTKKEKTEITEMTVTQLLAFASTLSKKYQFNLGKMTEGDAKCEKNIDFFDFMRIVVAMSTNLFDASSPEQSTEKLIGYIKSIAE